MNSVVEDGAFVGARGIGIRYRTWLPSGPPKGIVVIAHGFAEHGGRYAHVAKRLNADGLVVRAADHRGHGLSEGKRTSVIRFVDYVDDLTTVIAHAREQWTSLRVVLLGHSMGGLIALDLAVRDSTAIDGLVVSAPAACPGDVSKLKLALGRVLSLVAPNAGILLLPINRIRHEPDVA